MTIGSMMNITVSTERPTVTEDEYGGSVESFSENIASLAFKLDELSAQESMLNSRESHTVTARGYAEGGADILEKDKIVFGSREFRVVGVRPIRSPLGASHHTVCELEELT